MEQFVLEITFTSHLNLKILRQPNRIRKGCSEMFPLNLNMHQIVSISIEENQKEMFSDERSTLWIVGTTIRWEINIFTIQI